jgi:hypothetical protein
MSPSFTDFARDADIVEVRFDVISVSQVREIDKDTRDDKIGKCHKIVKWNLIHIATKHSLSTTEVARAALHYGIRRLWSFPGIDEIARIRTFVHKHDQESRGWFYRTNDLDLKTSDTAVLRTELFKIDIKLASSLASILGLSPPLVRQVAMMAALIENQDIPTRDVNLMVEILERFARYIQMRVNEAKRIEERVKEEIRIRPEHNESRKSWENVMATYEGTDRSC